MKLILFDIDGTLLTTDGAGRAALRAAGADVFTIEEDLEGVAVSGNTDVEIVHEILNKHGIPDSEINVNRYLGAYLAHLKQRLIQQPGDVLPGVAMLLDACVQDGCIVGLLTGNLRRGAQMKLGAHRLWDRFSVGAFADDNRDRNMLGPIAKKRAETEFRAAFDELFIVGDTPRDIACGKVANATVLAVATGRYSRESLAAHKPDYYSRICAKPRQCSLLLESGWFAVSGRGLAKWHSFLGRSLASARRVRHFRLRQPPRDQLINGE